MITVPVTVAAEGAAISVSLGATYSLIDGDHYKGEYTVTPSSETQTLQTANKVMDYNVVVDPIPQNYGLVTWNGSKLTIS